MKNVFLSMLFALCICCQSNDPGIRSITIAKGISENPTDPNIAIEFSNTGAIYVYTSIPIVPPFHYYSRELSNQESKKVLSYIYMRVMDPYFSRFSYTHHAEDATKFELCAVLRKNKILKSGHIEKLPWDDSLRSLFLLKNLGKLTPIKHHTFSTEIQNETLIPPKALPLLQE